VDHIQNDGAAHRREYGGGWRIYEVIRREGYPRDRYQLLCANCNLAKGHYGVCPHQARK
jgi:hypothetical protein